METTATQQQQQPNKKVLLVILVLMLLGGGVGLYFLLRPKKDDQPKEGGKEKKPVITGRNGSTINVDKIIDPSVISPDKLKKFIPKDEESATLIDGSPAAIQLQTEFAKLLAANSNWVSNAIRKNNIGAELVNGNKYDKDVQSAIDWMFHWFTGVTPGDTSTYPIYSTYEINGKQIRNELQVLIDTDWRSLNLTDVRAHGEPWYINSLQLNMFYGKRNIHTHNAHQIWMHQADRGGLDMFKKINGFDVGDRRLLEKQNGQGIFNAGNTWQIAKDYAKAIDDLDAALVRETQGKLEKLGWEFALPNLGGLGGSSSSSNQNGGTTKGGTASKKDKMNR